MMRELYIFYVCTKGREQKGLGRLFKSKFM